MFTLLSFIFFTALVAVISYIKTRNDNLNSETGYFLAGRSLPWFVIAGSLFLTNISAEQLTGLNANAFMNGANVMAWETTSALTLIVLAFVFLPRYLKSGVTTIPQFLENRYGKKMRIVASFIFLYAIVIGFLPFVLYAGAITLGKLFDVSNLLGTTDNTTTWIMVIAIGVIGGFYAVFGGLKAVAVSDTINGIGLLIAGMLVPAIGLYELGSGSMTEGFSILLSEAPERMNAAGLTADANIPWHGMISGVIIINLFFWCTNQAIIQRTLAAKNLAEGQKGVLAAGAMKIVGILMLVLPGIIAWHMHQRGMLDIPFKMADGNLTDVLNADMSYPILVREVLPGWLTGFFGAALFGAVLSSFNSGVNSLSTLISLDIYKQLIKPKATDLETVKVGRVFGIATIVICICIAPSISTSDSLYTLMRTIMAVINVPILAVIVMGVLSKRAPAIAAYVGLVFGMIFFYTTHFVMGGDLGFIQFHWLHLVGLNFVLMLSIMTVIRYLKPQEKAFVQHYTQEVEIKPWKHAKLASGLLVLSFVALYAAFSPLGLTSPDGSLLKVMAAIIGSMLGIYAVIHIVSKVIKNRMAQEANGESQPQ
ncbi:solute:sodium symporter family transporter [Photobacterium sanctipauli]|uniref:Solute:sodium symporter family transporter n=1 Tax=Photobacterium sanctipauli TaxID=1342794 RepID=A0A2T3P135_9GAMM|nr:solute:sodium symporter family transporter [Photobacterium sanctipauli]PSW22243.1 solute:sodium symporter family transporter [Photobacterium sanctipauli]